MYKSRQALNKAHDFTIDLKGLINVMYEIPKHLP